MRPVRTYAPFGRLQACACGRFFIWGRTPVQKPGKMNPRPDDRAPFCPAERLKTAILATNPHVSGTSTATIGVLNQQQGFIFPDFCTAEVFCLPKRSCDTAVRPYSAPFAGKTTLHCAKTTRYAGLSARNPVLWAQKGPSKCETAPSDGSSAGLNPHSA